jgi:hypothetical protein
MIGKAAQSVEGCEVSQKAAKSVRRLRSQSEGRSPNLLLSQTTAQSVEKRLLSGRKTPAQLAEERLLNQ